MSNRRLLRRGTPGSPARPAEAGDLRQSTPEFGTAAAMVPPTQRVDPAEPNAAARDGEESWSPLPVFGLPLAPFTLDRAVEQVERLLLRKQPAFVITANLNYAMLAAKDARLCKVNNEAAFVLADGMPLVWASRLNGTPLPCRVAGADLVPALCALAARRGYGVFLLGAAPGVAAEAARLLCKAYPGLLIAGIEAPEFHVLSAQETEAMKHRIRDSQGRLLLLAMGQPGGELWLAQHYRDLGNMVCMQLGASLDFAAGRVARAPRWMQKTGLEWVYRLRLEPRRMFGRYARNAIFLARMLWRGTLARAARRKSKPSDLTTH